MLLRKIFKIKGPRLAKNAFPEISAWKNWLKISQHLAFILILGVLKKLFAGFGEQLPNLPPPPPLATSLINEKQETTNVIFALS